MTTRRHLLSCLAWPATAWSAEPEFGARVRERLLDAPVLRGEFEQHKLIKGFRHPLLSRGDFVVARDRGVLWRTREPFAQSLLVTRDRLLARRADGQATTRIDVSREPALRVINQTLFALLGLDLAALSQHFTIDGELLGARGWRIVLLPRERPVAQWIERVELEGERFVRQLQFSEKSGDSTLIRFSRQQAAEALSAEEEAGFA